MLQARVIPCLLLKGGRLVKTTKFADPRYVGDPINAVRIFNDKEVDELILLDIDASRNGREPDYDRIGSIVDEAFMPVAYGGGISSLDQIHRLISLGVEKVVLNTVLLSNAGLAELASRSLGSQAVVTSINVRRDWRARYRVYDAVKRSDVAVSLENHIRQAVGAGAGELMLNDVTRDGTGIGYDLELVRSVCGSVSVPVTVCGGAGTLEHIREAVAAGASAAAAGSMFVYVGKHRAVLINYPDYSVLQSLLAGV